MRLAFGDCLFDGETRELRRANSVVHVSAKAFRLLEFLLERRPTAVAKTQLMEAVWPGVYVVEGNLTRLLAELREALGDDAKEPRFLRTVHGFGYAFSGEAARIERPAATSRDVVFKLVWADREIALHEGENVLGRERDAAAWIEALGVSRRHARIVVSGETAALEDLGSKNGTFLDGEPVTAPRSLTDGSRVRIGTVELVVRCFRGGVPTASLGGLET